MSFGGAFFILPGERGVVAKEGLWMVYFFTGGLDTGEWPNQDKNLVKFRASQYSS